MSEHEMQSAIAIIKDEHRSLAVVIKGMSFLLERAQASGEPPDFPLLRAALYYIETFTEALHHPKEEAYLFRLLREHTGEFDEQLARLEREHAEEEQTYYELARTLKRYGGSTADGPAAFAEVFNRFAAEAWKHMSFEEEVILPAATRYLTPEDWQKIAQAFSANGDPRFGRAPDQQFGKLFAHIQSLMPEGADL